MKATGIIRPVDILGRVVLPKKLRLERGMLQGEPIEMWLDGQKIVLERYYDSCIFCGTDDPLTTLTIFRSQAICIDCRDELSKQQALGGSVADGFSEPREELL